MTAIEEKEDKYEVIGKTMRWVSGEILYHFFCGWRQGKLKFVINSNLASDLKKMRDWDLNKI